MIKKFWITELISHALLKVCSDRDGTAHLIVGVTNQ